MAAGTETNAKKPSDLEGEGKGGGKKVATVKKLAAKRDIITTPIEPVDENKVKVLEIYAVEPPPVDPETGEERPATMDDRPHYSYVRIQQDLTTSDILYEVIEPPLTEEQKDILEYLEEEMIDEIDYSQDDIEDIEERKSRLRATMSEVLFKAGINVDSVVKERLFYYIYRDFMGYGRIQVMMIDPMLEDISCDGHGVPIYVFHRKHGSIRTNRMFPTEDELNKFVIQIAQKCGREISKANPILDATMPDGSRLNTSLGTEVTTRGSTFTIRRFRENPLTVIDLINSNTLSSEMAAFLWLTIENGSSLMCAGGTASGKTTTLNALALFIPPSAKIVTIEDTREINIPHENWIPGLTREIKSEEEEGSGEGGGGGKNIDMFELLKAAMRQRPDYMIVGEVRGKETMTVFQAMSTGQTVFSTLHADSVESVVHRLENPPINVPRILVLSLNFVLLQAQVRFKGKRGRRIRRIDEIWDIDPDNNQIRVVPVFTWTPAGDEFRFSGTSKYLDKIADMEGMTHKEILDEIKRRQTVIEWLLARYRAKEPIDYKVVFRTVQQYKQDPEGTLQEAKAYLEG